MPGPIPHPPLAYFLTFTTHGARLHGDDRGSVDRHHNGYGSPYLGSDPVRNARESAHVGVAVELGLPERRVIDRTIREVCEHRRWQLLALNVRTRHIHLVLAADVPPERAIADLKAWCTRRLVEADCFERGARLWARHGSTRYVWNRKGVEDSVEYVLNEQGPSLV